VSTKLGQAMAQGPVDSLAKSTCPRCGVTIGTDEANRAFDRAHQCAKDHTYARVEPADYSSALTICPGCGVELIFWVVTRTLHAHDDVRKANVDG
jgi:predicted RNA-binding Zn-ribbon protein involved in translation (DUF1610 family)